MKVRCLRGSYTASLLVHVARLEHVSRLIGRDELPLFSRLISDIFFLVFYNAIKFMQINSDRPTPVPGDRRVRVN